MWPNPYAHIVCSKYKDVMQQRQDEKHAFRSCWRATHNGSSQYRYPWNLDNIAPFAEWFENHVYRMRNEGFLVSQNLEQLSHPPSTMA